MTFEEEYEKLEKTLYGSNPEDEDWFLSGLLELINKYSPETIWYFALNQKSTLYIIELLTKAGLRKIDEEYLVSKLNSHDEDEIYSTALILTICEKEYGLETLKEFASGIHPKQKNIHPIDDLLPDLKFISCDYRILLEDLIQNYQSKY